MITLSSFPCTLFTCVLKIIETKYFVIILEEYIIFQEIAGYNYYGTETMYSGTDGVEMKAEIFFGIVHYQRLRHMVSDKFQVRNQGPIDQVRFDLNSLMKGKGNSNILVGVFRNVCYFRLPCLSPKYFHLFFGQRNLKSVLFKFLR